jgi:hypothetical protein
MNDQVNPDEAARALAEIDLRQQQVIDLATLPRWYWWTIGALMVVLAAGVDTHNHGVVAVAVGVFVLGLLGSTAWVLGGSYRHAPLRNALVDQRGVLAILCFVGVIVGVTLGVAFSLRAAGVSDPATLACVVGGVLLGAGGPPLMRLLRRIMLGNRIGARRAGIPR